MPDGIKAGSLFVDLGIRGGDKTVGTLVSAKKGMGDVASMSLEAKAGILAAVYGLERLMQTSAQLGTTLTNFKALTGLPPVMVQQYMYAARQIGIANEDVMGSFKALQGAVAQIDINKGLPEGLKFISNTLGGLDVKKLHDLPSMMQEFQKFAQSNVSEGVKRWALGSVGLSEGMIAAMERNAFQPEVLSKAPHYSEAQLKNLDRVNIAWSNLGNKVAMAFGNLTVKHGGALVKNIDMIATATIRLGDALTVLAEKAHAFESLGHTLEGVSNTIRLINEIIDKLSGNGSKKGDLLYTPPGQEMLPGWKDSPANQFLTGQWEMLKTGFGRMAKDFGVDVATPRIAESPSPVSNKTEIKQNITHVGDAKDTQAVKNLHKAAAQAERSHAYRQSGANLRGN